MNRKLFVIGMLFSVTLLFVSVVGFGQKRYSGNHHTSSHGGRYSGGKGSSHKSGHYKNAKTNNHYGKHKK